jgi:flagella basal body P-ring formation protein FlgA
MANPAVFFVTESMIAEAARPQLLAQGIHPESEVKVFKLPRAMISDSEQPELIISNLNYNANGRSFSARAEIAGKPETGIAVAGRILRMIDVPVLTSALRSNDLIKPSDLGSIKVEEATLGRNAITDPADLLGKAAKQSIVANTVIRQDMVRLPLAVRKNTIVTVTYQTGALSISHQVRALEDGSLGDAVRVSNTQTNRIFDTTVIGNDLVAVGDGKPKAQQVSANSQQ